MSMPHRGAQMALHPLRQKELRLSHQAHKKKICEICGDIDVQEAIITCYRCKNVDVHEYCKRGCGEEAPKDWCCQECDNGQGIMSSLPGRENDYSEGSMLHASAKILQSTAPSKKPSKFPGSRGIDWEKEVQTGKTRYIPVKEALSLPSRINKYGNPLNITDSSRFVTTKSMATWTIGNFSKPGAQVSNSFPEKSSLRRFLGSAGYTNPHNLKNVKITEQSKKPVQSSKGSGDSTVLKLGSPGAANEGQMMKTAMTHPYDPALAPPLKNSMLGYGEDAPEGWRSGKGIISSSRRLENEYSEGYKLDASAKISQSTVRPKKRVRFPDGNSINWEKEVQTGKTRYRPVDEELSQSKKKTDSSRVASTKSMATVTQGNIC